MHRAQRQIRTVREGDREARAGLEKARAKEREREKGGGERRKVGIGVREGDTNARIHYAKRVETFT